MVRLGAVCLFTLVNLDLSNSKMQGHTSRYKECAERNFMFEISDSGYDQVFNSQCIAHSWEHAMLENVVKTWSWGCGEGDIDISSAWLECNRASSKAKLFSQSLPVPPWQTGCLQMKVSSGERHSSVAWGKHASCPWPLCSLQPDWGCVCSTSCCCSEHQLGLSNTAFSHLQLGEEMLSISPCVWTGAVLPALAAALALWPLQAWKHGTYRWTSCYCTGCGSGKSSRIPCRKRRFALPVPTTLDLLECLGIHDTGGYSWD